MKYLLLITLITLASCSPIKRLNRLIKKHPELIQTDTIVRHDTVEVIVPEVKHDTTFLEKHLYDTVEIEKERLRIKIWRKFDTIHVEGECESDTVTVVREVKIPVKYYEKTTFWDKIKGYLIFFIILCALTYAYMRFKK
jgi:hypothetical protein